MVLAISGRLEPGRDPTAETRRAGTRHHNNEATGSTGVNKARPGRASFTAAAESSQRALSGSKGQKGAPLYCTSPEGRREMKGGRRGWAWEGRRLRPPLPLLAHPVLLLQIWHITLKRPQACVRISNENALEKRSTEKRVRKTGRYKILRFFKSNLCLISYLFILCFLGSFHSSFYIHESFLKFSLLASWSVFLKKKAVHSKLKCHTCISILWNEF